MEISYDLIVIGGGPAGITAGIYAARQNMKTLLVTKSFGGQMAKKTVAIENYTGFEEISGLELIEKFEKHLKRQQISFEFDEVSKVQKTKEGFSVSTKNSKKFSSKAVIVAAGANPKPLGVPGEKEFVGRGVSYCTACDGPIFTNKIVAVIGGGNAGLEAALFLSTCAAKIYVLEYGSQIKGEPAVQKRALENNKIEIITQAELLEIKGDKFVRSIMYQDMGNNQQKEISVAGVFSEIGHEPEAAFLGDLADFNEKKEIVIDQKTNQTKTPGLFAAGDVADSIFKQIIISAGDGAKAALSAHRYIQKL